jgi:hypothetical protein
MITKIFHCKKYGCNLDSIPLFVFLIHFHKQKPKISRIPKLSERAVHVIMRHKKVTLRGYSIREVRRDKSLICLYGKRYCSDLQYFSLFRAKFADTHVYLGPNLPICQKKKV